MSSYGKTEVEAETKKLARNDARVAAYTAEVALYGATSLRGTPYEAKRVEAVADAAKSTDIIAIIDV
jgi:hypothetical protein